MRVRTKATYTADRTAGAGLRQGGTRGGKGEQGEARGNEGRQGGTRGGKGE